MIVEILLFVSFLVFLIPSIYLAAQKNYMFFLNKKRNTFLARFFFLAPTGMAFNALFIFFAMVFFLILLSSVEMNNVAIYVLLLIVSILGSLLTILYFKKYALRKDVPPEYQEDFMEHEFYIFMPRDRINDRMSYDEKKYNRDILFTKFGSLLANEKALKIFEENNLTGYEIRNAGNERTRDSSSFYSQIVSTSEMPQMLPQTKLKQGFFYESLTKGSLINDDVIYYNKSDASGSSDFNKTIESFGTNNGMPYVYQKFWIVSHKTMTVFMNRFDMEKRDFIPVILIDDEKDN